MGLGSVQYSNSISAALLGLVPHDLDPAIRAELALLRSGDDTAFNHLLADARLMATFARHLMMDLTDAEHLGPAGLPHDLGNLELNMAVLDEPAALTADGMTQGAKSSAPRPHDPVAGWRLARCRPCRLPSPP